jgi:hypothetical protein
VNIDFYISVVALFSLSSLSEQTSMVVTSQSFSVEFPKVSSMPFFALDFRMLGRCYKPVIVLLLVLAKLLHEIWAG